MKSKQLLTMTAGALGLALTFVTMMQASVLYAGRSLPEEQAPVGGTIPISVILTSSKDNTLYESISGTLSNGAGDYFFVGNTRLFGIRRGLVAFDLVDKVPSGATMVSATLQLSMSKTSAGATAVSLHRTLSDWGEGNSNANGNEGGGAPATPGDATWLHTVYDTALWQTPGGDFVPTATATLVVAGPDFYHWSSPALVTDLQRWLDDPTSNLGWVILGDEASTQTTKRFATREHPTAAIRPQLTLVYMVGVTETENVYLPLVQQ